MHSTDHDRTAASLRDARLERVKAELGRQLWLMYFEADAPYGFSTEGWRLWLERDAAGDTDERSRFVGVPMPPRSPTSPRKATYRYGKDPAEGAERRS